MRVKFFATYRDITGVKEEDIPAPPDVWTLLLILCDRYSGFRVELLSADGTDISDEPIILINGRNICHISGKDTPLCECDTVSLFPMVAGG